MNPECVVLAKEFGGPSRDGQIMMDNLRLAQRLKDILADPERLAAMRNCPRPVSEDSPHAQRCLELLSDPHVSPLAGVELGADGRAHYRVELPDAMAALRPDQESTLFFCSVCDAVASQ